MYLIFPIYKALNFWSVFLIAFVFCRDWPQRHLAGGSGRSCALLHKWCKFCGRLALKPLRNKLMSLTFCCFLSVCCQIAVESQKWFWRQYSLSNIFVLFLTKKNVIIISWILFHCIYSLEFQEKTNILLLIFIFWTFSFMWINRL